jgi:hypothetical protein
MWLATVLELVTSQMLHSVQMAFFNLSSMISAVCQARVYGLEMKRSTCKSSIWDRKIIEERLKIKLGPPGNRLREQGVRGVTEEESDEMVNVKR